MVKQKILTTREKKIIKKLIQNYSTKEIAQALELDELDVMQAFEAVKDAVSIQEPIYSDGGDTIYLEEQIADKKDKVGLDMNIMLREAINKLKEKERYIIYKRYFEGITQMELSEEIGISQAQISRIEKNCLDNMKKLLK